MNDVDEQSPLIASRTAGEALLVKTWDPNDKANAKEEEWHFRFVDERCVLLYRGSNVYHRSPDNDPREDGVPGAFFYRALGGGKIERIRVYDCLRGEIRENTVADYFEDWSIVKEWRIV